MTRILAACAVLLAFCVIGGGCGAATGASDSTSSTPANSPPDAATKLLDSIVAAVGPSYFTDVSFGHSTDTDIVSPDAPWLVAKLAHPTVGSGTADYWAAVLVEQEFNAQAQDASVEPVAGETLSAPTDNGEWRTDGRVDNPHAQDGTPLAQDQIRQDVTTGINDIAGAKLLSLSFIGTNADVPVVTAQTDDAEQLVKQTQNPYFALFRDDNIEGGYVQFNDASGQTVLVGARVPGQGFTTVWVPQDLDWHTYHQPE